MVLEEDTRCRSFLAVVDTRSSMAVLFSVEEVHQLAKVPCFQVLCHWPLAASRVVVGLHTAVHVEAADLPLMTFVVAGAVEVVLAVSRLVKEDLAVQGGFG